MRNPAIDQHGRNLMALQTGQDIGPEIGFDQDKKIRPDEPDKQGGHRQDIERKGDQEINVAGHESGRPRASTTASSWRA